MQNNKRFFGNKLPLAAAVTGAVMTTPVMAIGAIDFHGYARAGLSTTSDGGEQLCYGSGANAHFAGRLGDECDTYGEISLGDELFNQDGKVFRFDSMFAYEALNQGNDYQTLNGPKEVIGAELGTNSNGDPIVETTTAQSEPWAGGDWALREAYGSAKGVIGWAPEATLWAGKRYYQRKDVHILDLYYVNNSGYGAGLEGIDLGAGKFSLAFTNFDTPGRLSGIETQVQNNKLDLRYAFPVGSGNLELIGIYGYADLTDAQDDAQANVGKDIDRDGYFLTAEYSQGIMGGFNKFIVQYAKGSMGDQAYVSHGGGASLNSTWWAGTMEESWRILDWGVVKLSDKVELGYSALYQQGTAYGPLADEDADKLSVVLRPQYNWTNFMKTSLEVGYTSEDGVDTTESSDLSKVVIAQEWSAGPSFWARPTIRLYAGSFFRAEDRDDDGNIRVGAQVEAWW